MQANDKEKHESRGPWASTSARNTQLEMSKQETPKIDVSKERNMALRQQKPIMGCKVRGAIVGTLKHPFESPSHIHIGTLKPFKTSQRAPKKLKKNLNPPSLLFFLALFSSSPPSASDRLKLQTFLPGDDFFPDLAWAHWRRQQTNEVLVGFEKTLFARTFQLPVLLGGF